MRDKGRKLVPILAILIAAIIGAIFLELPTAFADESAASAATSSSVTTSSAASTVPVSASASASSSATTTASGATTINSTAPLKTPDYKSFFQKIYDDTNGLPGGIANDIAQTDDGVLWVATYGGLYRYAGRDFQMIKGIDSVKSVNCLYVDNQNRLWVGSNDGGVTVLKDGEVVGTLDKKSGLPSNSVHVINMDSNGNFYIGTTNGLAIATMTDKLQVTHLVPEVVYSECMSPDSNGHMAVVTDSSGLFILQENKVLTTARSPIAGTFFTSCTFKDDQKLLAGTSDSTIVEYDFQAADGTATLTQTGVIEVPGLDTIKSIEFGPKGTMIICAFNGIGYITPDGTFEAVKVEGFNSSITQSLVDYQGNIWFASGRQGLLKLCDSPFNEIYLKLGLPAVSVNSVMQWQGNYYFATDDGVDVASGDLTQVLDVPWAKSLKGTRVRALQTDGQGNLWVSTSGAGAWRIAPASSEGNASTTDIGPIKVFNKASGANADWFRSALPLSDGTMALATDVGITFINGDEITGTIGYDDGLETAKVLCMIEVNNPDLQPDGSYVNNTKVNADPNNRSPKQLLAGTDGGGIAVIENGKVVRTLTTDDGLTSNVVMRMVLDPRDEGLFMVTSNSLCFGTKTTDIRELSQFPYYNNYDVTIGPDGNLYVTSSAGVYVVNRDALLSATDGSTVSYSLLNTDKGLDMPLTSNSWNYVDQDQNLMLAGGQGVVSINMKEFGETHPAYKLDFAPITVGDKQYKPDENGKITVPRDAQRIMVSPEVMNYSTSNPYISYYLEGFDKEPQVVRLNELGDVTYTNLAPGNYTFHMAVQDDSGQTISESLLPFTKKKEFYDYAWFWACIGMLIALLVVVITWHIQRIRMKRQLEKSERELAFMREQVEMSNQAIITIARTVDAKDPNTSEHSYRVSQYSLLIGERLGLDEEQLRELRRTALLHDIGKVGIPDNVLKKPGRLTDEEYAIMKTHPVLGGQILKKFTSVEHIIDGAQYHHERWDGKGYPAGLAGEEIPFFARIIGTADAFDAMTANRVYRNKLDTEFVVNELKRCSGSQFDPTMDQILLDLIADGSISIEAMYQESTADDLDRVKA